MILLLGLMAGVAAPRYQRAMADASLRSAASRLAADLRHARQVARTRGQSVTIEFSADTDSYQAAAGDQAVLTESDRPSQGLAVRLDSRVALTNAAFDSTSRVEFDFRGDPVHAGSVQLSNRFQTYTVSVNALGVVEVTP